MSELVVIQPNELLSRFSELSQNFCQSHSGQGHLEIWMRSRNDLVEVIFKPTSFELLLIDPQALSSEWVSAKTPRRSGLVSRPALDAWFQYSVSNAVKATQHCKLEIDFYRSKSNTTQKAICGPSPSYSYSVVR